LSRKTGFTLLELIVVLFILTLLTALVAPAFNRSFGQAQLKAAARDLAALCRFARTQAIISQVVLEVVLDRRTNSYWLRRPDPIVGDLRDSDRVAPAQNLEQSIQNREARVRSLPAGVTLKSVIIETGPLLEEERGAITFFPEGSSTGGEIWLADEKGRGYRIVVDSSVGLVHVNAAEKA